MTIEGSDPITLDPATENLGFFRFWLKARPKNEIKLCVFFKGINVLEN